jgi:hypothetical protein
MFASSQQFPGLEKEKLHFTKIPSSFQLYTLCKEAFADLCSYELPDLPRTAY